MKPWNKKACQLRLARDTALLDSHNREAIANFDATARVLQTVCKTYGVSIRSLQNHCRKRKFCWPRQLAIYFIKQDTTYNLSQIAALFRVYPSAVLHSIKTVQNALETSPLARLEVAALARARPVQSSKFDVQGSKFPTSP